MLTSTLTISDLTPYRPVYAPKDFLEVLLWIRSPNYRPIEYVILLQFISLYGLIFSLIPDDVISTIVGILCCSLMAVVKGNIRWYSKLANKVEYTIKLQLYEVI